MQPLSTPSRAEPIGSCPAALAASPTSSLHEADWQRRQPFSHTTAPQTCVHVYVGGEYETNGSLSITLPNAARPNYLRPRTAAAMSLSLVFQVVSFNGPAIPAPRPQMQVSMDQGLVDFPGPVGAVPNPERLAPRGESSCLLVTRDREPGAHSPALTLWRANARTRRPPHSQPVDGLLRTCNTTHSTVRQAVPERGQAFVARVWAAQRGTQRSRGPHSHHGGTRQPARARRSARCSSLAFAASPPSALDVTHR